MLTLIVLDSIIIMQTANADDNDQQEEEMEVIHLCCLNLSRLL
jgi:hypothetical protein